MSTFGQRGQVIAIPTSTIERIVPLLLKDGRIARGWLGVALQAVAVPDALRESAGQSSGLMVMSVVEDGPAARAGIVAGANDPGGVGGLGGWVPEKARCFC